MKDPNGQQIANDLSGYEVYREVVDTAGEGSVVVSDYAALTESSTIILVFRGEQPTDDGLAAMLASLAPLSP